MGAGLVATAVLLPSPALASPPTGPPEKPLADGLTYKPGTGLTVRTRDGRFAMNLNLWGQLLAQVRHTPPVPGVDTDSTLTLEIRRARAVFSGHLFSPHVLYNFHMMFSPWDLGFTNGAPRRPPIFQYFMTFTRLRDLQIQAGFFFVPFAGTRNQPPPRLPMIDISVAGSEFFLDQDIGLQLGSQDLAGLQRLRYYAGVFLGDGYDYARAGDLGLMYLGRLEAYPLGMLGDYLATGLTETIPPRFSVALAYAFTDRDRRDRAITGTTWADGGSASNHNLTADLTLKVAGLSLTTDVFLRRGWRQPGALETPDGAPIAVKSARSGLGWTVQGGIFLPRTTLELMARFSGVRPARSLATSLARLDELGGGFNYYFMRHAFKLQLDYIHTWGPALPARRSDQVRLQLQITF